MAAMEEESRVVVTWVFVVSCVLAMLGLIPSVLFLVFNLKYRRVRLIKMSSPNLNVVISLGGLVGYLSLVLWGLEAFSENWEGLATTICRVRTWVLPVTFTLMFGSLLVKSWRVRKIFRTAQAKVIIRDQKLFAMLGVLLFLDLLILLLWQLTDPLQSSWVTHTVVSLPDRSYSATYRQCNSHYSSIWWSAIYLYKTVTLLYASYLSWSVRAVTIPSMNESVAIVTSCLATTFTGSATAAITVAFSHWPNVTSCVTMVSVWLCVTFTLCVVYVPKISMWWKKSDEEMMKIHVTGQLISSPNQSVDQVEGEILHLVAENRTLRKSLTQKEDAIKELQTTVTKAKDKLHELLQREDSRHDSGLDIDLSSSDLQINSQAHTNAQEVVSHENSATECTKVKTKGEGQVITRPTSNKEKGGVISKWRMFKTNLKSSGNSKNVQKTSRSKKGDKSSPSSARRRRDYFPGDGSECAGFRSHDQTLPAPAYLSTRVRDSISDIAHHMELMDSLTNQLHSSITRDTQRHGHVPCDVIYPDVTSGLETSEVNQNSCCQTLSASTGNAIDISCITSGDASVHAQGAVSGFTTSTPVYESELEHGRQSPPLPYGDCCYASYRAPSLPPPVGGVYYAGSRVPYLAGSIVDSYNLDRDSDTMSYVSNHLSNARNDVMSENVVNRTSPDSVTSASLRDVLSSRDNLLPRQQIYTLENDKYYPSTHKAAAAASKPLNQGSPPKKRYKSSKNNRRNRRCHDNRTNKQHRHKVKQNQNAFPSQPFDISFV